MSDQAINGGAVRLDAGTTLADMRLAPSHDGQYLFIYCGQRLVAILGSMGGDVEVFEFGDAERMSALELIERIAPVG